MFGSTVGDTAINYMTGSLVTASDYSKRPRRSSGRGFDHVPQCAAESDSDHDRQMETFRAAAWTTDARVARLRVSVEADSEARAQSTPSVFPQAVVGHRPAVAPAPHECCAGLIVG
jgi:hypothetical protein